MSMLLDKRYSQQALVEDFRYYYQVETVLRLSMTEQPTNKISCINLHMIVLRVKVQIHESSVL